MLQSSKAEDWEQGTGSSHIKAGSSRHLGEKLDWSKFMMKWGGENLETLFLHNSIKAYFCEGNQSNETMADKENGEK